MQTIGKSNQDRHLCDDCIYRARGDRVVNNCDYIFITGHSRGCPADECTVYETGKRKAVRRLSDVSDTNVGDTISRQAAIDAVSEACFELRGIFKECEERLLALPSAQPERWIPVSERLPKEEKEVLITAWKDTVLIAWRSEGVWNCDSFFFDDSTEVSAWMPLPKPYKGGEADG